MKKRKIEIVVISGIYLGSPDCHAQELLTYLSSIRPATLILNGGLFTPFGDGPAILPAQHKKVLEKLSAMAREGTRVYLLQDPGVSALSPVVGTGIEQLPNRAFLLLEQDGKRIGVFPGRILELPSGLMRSLVRFGTTGFRVAGILCRWGRATGLMTASGMAALAPKDSESHIQQQHQGRRKQTISRLALSQDWDTVICGRAVQAGKEYIEGPQGSCLYLDSGGWSSGGTTLEYTFKRWKIYRFREDKLRAFYADEELKGLGVEQFNEKDFLPDPGAVNRGVLP